MPISSGAVRVAVAARSATGLIQFAAQFVGNVCLGGIQRIENPWTSSRAGFSLRRASIS